MKILYLSFNNPELSPGVFRKEREFCDFFGNLGRDNDLDFRGLCIVASQGNRSTSRRAGAFYEVREVPSRLYGIFSQIPLICSLFRIGPVFGEAYRDIEAFDPDAIIWRYNITYVPGRFNPKGVCKKTLLVTEHQAKEAVELRMSTLGRLIAPLIQWNGKRVLRNVDALIGVTSEIADYERELAGRPVPCFTLTNGIDVQSYPLKTRMPPLEKTLRLLYVGSHTAGWQGLDRVLNGMARFDGDTRIELHVAGHMDDSTKRLIRSLGIEGGVKAHGYLSGKELDALFDLSHLAVATLGMHRKQLVHGSTLKVREYMARGIPFIISHRDEDIVSDLPYIFHAPSNDSPIDFHEVVSFAEDLLKDQDHGLSQQMRRYALEHMDYCIKTTKLLGFMRSLVSKT